MPVDVDVVEVPGRRMESGWVDVVDLAPARRAVLVGECADYVDPAALLRFRAGLLAVTGMDLPVAKVLSRMDAFVGECGLGLPVSLSYAVVDGIHGTATVASAGAPPALVIGPEGVHPLAEGVSPPLGIGSRMISVNEARIPQGSVLVFSTTPFLASASASTSSKAHQLAALVLEHSEERLVSLGPALQRAARRGGATVAMALARVTGDDSSIERIRVVPEPRAASSVRERIRELCAAWSITDGAAVHAILLVATELLANAILHSRSRVEILIAQTGSGVLLEVADSSSAIPHATRVPYTEPDGRGMVLVSDLCTRWGSRWQDGGKVVWAQVPFPDGVAEEREMVVDA